MMENRRFKVILIAYCSIACLAAQASAQYALEWTGAGDGVTWDDVANWTLKLPMEPGNNRYIYSGSPIAGRLDALAWSIYIYGGAVTINSLYLVNDANLIVDGPGSTCSIPGVLELMGPELRPATVNILAGGKMSANRASIGTWSANDRIVVDGAGSELMLAHLDVGEGSDGTGILEILNGGQISTTGSVYIGHLLCRGTVKVDGSGSELIGAYGQQTYIGGVGGTGTLDILNGGEVFTGLSVIAADHSLPPWGSKSYGHVTISGPGSNWTTYALDMWTGWDGTGIVDIRDGGTVSVESHGVITSQSGGQGRIEVNGAGSVLAIGEGGLQLSEADDDQEPASPLCQVNVNQGTIQGTTADSFLIAHGSNAGITGPGNYDIKVVYESDPDYCDNNCVTATFDPGCLTVGGAYDVNQITPTEFVGWEYRYLLESSVFAVDFNGVFSGKPGITIPYDESELAIVWHSNEDDANYTEIINEKDLKVAAKVGREYKRLSNTEVDPNMNLITADTNSLTEFGVYVPDKLLCPCPFDWIRVDDLDGNADRDVLMDYQKDDMGNSVELWQVNYDRKPNAMFVVRYVPKGDPNVYYIGACLYLEGRNRMCNAPFDDDNNNRIPDVFVGMRWENWMSIGSFGINGDTYTFTPSDKSLKRESHGTSTYPNMEWETAPQSYTELIPAPKSMQIMPQKLESEAGYEVSGSPPQMEVYRVLDIRLGQRTDDVWHYTLYLDQPTGATIEPNDQWGIGAGGVTNAWVSGDAALDQYGAWQVDEITPTSVTFRATKTAFIIDRPALGDFHIASSHPAGSVPWLSTGNDINTVGYVAGPLVNPLLGDLDNDGDVDSRDFALFGNNWHADRCQWPGSCDGADLAPETRDGIVNVPDLEVLAGHWLEGTIP